MQNLEVFLKNRIKRGARLWKIFSFLHNSPKKIFLYINRDILKSSIFIFKDELSMASLFPKKLIDKVIEREKPKRVLDVGCGVGKSLDYFFEKGIEVFGVEGSRVAIASAKNKQFIIRHNLNKELRLNRKFDLIWSFEFVEHIHPKFVDNLMRTFSNHSDKVIISAARPGQGGEGHFNEKPPEFWITIFEKYGYKFINDETDWLRDTDEFFSKNMLVFKRKL